MRLTLLLPGHPVASAVIIFLLFVGILALVFLAGSDDD